MASNALRARTTGNNSHTPISSADREFIDRSLGRAYMYVQRVEAESLNPGCRGMDPGHEGRTAAKRVIEDSTALKNHSDPGRTYETKSPPTVFVTYAPTAPKEPVLHIVNHLRSQGIKARVDIYEEKLQSMNMNEWLSDNIESDFVVVCVDKSYAGIASATQSTEETDEPKKNYTAFVFNQLQTEIIHNACTNSRVLPVLIDGAKFMNLPRLLQNTTPYYWPKDHQKLVDRVFLRQSFHPPPVGPPPPMIFETV